MVVSSSQNIWLHVIIITYVLDLYYNLQRMYVFPLSDITSVIQQALKPPGVYLVSFGPLNFILGIHYDDALQDLFDLYRETTFMHHPPIGRKW